MSDRQLPYPLRKDWNPSGPYRNPGATNPLPNPANMPVSAWFGARVPVVWAAAADPAATFEADWASPTFDLYPQLRGLSDNSTNNLAAGSQPVWKGPSAMFRFQLSSPVADGLGGLDLRGFRVTYREFGHISDVTQVTSIDAAQDISAQVTAAQGDSVVFLSPKPLRYYRLIVKFEVLVDFNYAGGNGPEMYIQGAMY